MKPRHILRQTTSQLKAAAGLAINPHFSCVRLQKHKSQGLKGMCTSISRSKTKLTATIYHRWAVLEYIEDLLRNLAAHFYLNYC